ncbi:CpsD/CapB family tyrosine-protein kinase [Clostridium sp. SHJSY1]|uniref:CpsD/CapB family tyrosine-protein kinase n=1 Tax=Clostridium sp. SHJSY1 TaxID=2942483 RepID=UPI0028741B48|nr:CpsD/CapB family tyrosine-protein kinase [Clostridium sp. SHJSY1]MDS0526661.1 CpsD/CapB family tyrosine-protein kinase [Clostridium sp. SHJSY1]
MFIVEKKPKSITAESYRTLRTNIQYSSFDEEIRTIVVTSSEPGEGKSTTAGNLALSFAQTEKNTIIIDCDLRKPALHKQFRISNLVGLSDVLIGKEKINSAVHEYNNHLSVLTSGKLPPNPAEMLGSKAMSKLLKELKDYYDIIILDSAPLHAVTDAQILSTKADGTILVVRAERTKRDTVIQAKSLLDKVGANILGIVLNGIENTRKKYYYYYGNEGKE